MYTIYDFDIKYNDFDYEATNLDDIDYEKIDNIYISTIEKKEYELRPTFAITVSDLQTDKPEVVFKTNYTRVIDFDKEIKVPIVGNVKDTILAIIDRINEEYDANAFKFFNSDEWFGCEIYKQLSNINNDNIYKVSQIIQNGCLDFRLDSKFIVDYTKMHIANPEKLVPIDMDAFHFEHMLKVAKKKKNSVLNNTFNRGGCSINVK